MLLVAFWLPVQAIASIGMPYCRHGQPAATTAVVTDHCHGHESKPVIVKHGMACDDCGFCHLATAGFMPSSEPSTALLALAENYGSRAQAVPASAVPEPPQQPPKRLN